MELSNNIFDWMCSVSGVLSESHVHKRKKTSVVLTQQATKAMLSGHMVNFLVVQLLNVRRKRTAAGAAVTSDQAAQQQQGLVGNPGETLAPEATHYNWNIVCEALTLLGIGLSPDHRMLLGNADPGIILDLINTMFRKMGPSASTSPVRGRERHEDRSGAVSVDQGKDRLRKKRRDEEGGESTAFDVFKDLERIRRKREDKLKKQQEVEERAKEVELKMKQMRDRLNPIDVRRGLLENENVVSAPLPCFLQFSNRANVHICHQLVLELISQVASGAAQEALRAKEAERRRAKAVALRRRVEGDRFVPMGAVTVPREHNHRTVVMCKDLVYEMMVLATLPETKVGILRREVERNAALRNADQIKKKIDRLYDMRSVRRKHDEAKADQDVKEEAERLERQRRYAEMRKENEERAAKDAEVQRQLRLEKELAQKRADEEIRRKEAEKVLYYAEQKARVLELRRMKAVEDELRKAKEWEDERELRERRRQKAIEISRKLMSKELLREQASAARGSVPTSLSPISCGTGHRSGYTGQDLGWQFLTDEERRVGELVLAVRSDPQEAVQLMTSRMENTIGKHLWFSDESGRRHPLTLVEGPESQNQLHQLLRDQPQRLYGVGRSGNRSVASIDTSLESAGAEGIPAGLPESHVSIALTLAARCHACDLAYHGIADPKRWHIGSDGSSATQRVIRFGTGLGGPGTTQEVVVSVVRPIEVQLSASDVVGFALVDDGCPSRENREALLRCVAACSGAGSEMFGVGHAIAVCASGDVVVEVFVLLFTSGTYTDKPVAQLAASQYQSLLATAEPFLHDERIIFKGVATSKKDLYVLNNVTIGRRSDGMRPEKLQRLAAHRPRQDRSPDQLDDDPIALPAPSQKKVKARPLRAPPPPQGQVEPDDDESEEAPQHRSEDSHMRRRLSSFLVKYAPERVAAVEAALELNRGNEEAMFIKLTEKYGPEPTTPPSGAGHDASGEQPNSNEEDGLPGNNDAAHDVDDESESEHAADDPDDADVGASQRSREGMTGAGDTTSQASRRYEGADEDTESHASEHSHEMEHVSSEGAP